MIKYVLQCLCSHKAIVFKNIKYNMREWLSGGAPPCQGGGRGFDPRLALSQITKRTSKWEVLFCYPRSAKHFSNPNCFAVWVRFLGSLKRPSVVPEPRSTGPCGTRLIMSVYSDIFLYKFFYFGALGYWYLYHQCW